LVEPSFADQAHLTHAPLIPAELPDL
jgi:hypothetical protein